MTSWSREGRVSSDQKSRVLEARNDALLLGPGGEVEAAHAAGNLDPAVPEPIVGRVPVLSPTDNIQDAAAAAAFNTAAPLVTFESTLASFASQIATLVPSQTVPAATQVALSSVLGAVASTPISTPSISLSTQPGPSSIAPVASTSTPAPPPTSSGSTGVSTTSVKALSSTMTSSSSSVPPSSSSTSPVVVSTLSTGHNTDFYVAVACAVVTVIAFVITFLFWYLRLRSRSRRQAIQEKTAWPWDHDDRPIEDGFVGIHHSTNWREPSVYSALPLPAGMLSRDDVMHDSHHIPMPQSPYKVVHTHGIHQSVPDLAPDMGDLKIANYVPGDSRATSRLSTNHDPSGSHHGGVSSMENVSVMRAPWSPLRPRSTRSGAGLAIMDEKSAVYPYTDSFGYTRSASQISAHSQANSGWAASLRSNLANALQNVLGSGSKQPEDHYTPAPLKLGRGSSAGSKDGLSRSTTTIDFAHAPPTGRIIDTDNLSAWLARGRQPAPKLPLPPVAVVKSRDRACPSMSRDSSAYSTSSLPDPFGDGAMNPSAEEYGLPTIPMSHSGSESSLQLAVRESSSEGRSPDPESCVPDSSRLAAEDTRMRSNTEQSAVSMMSTESGPLTAEEQFARSVLRQRRNLSMVVDDEAIRRPQQQSSSRSASKKKKSGKRSRGKNVRSRQALITEE